MKVSELTFLTKGTFYQRLEKKPNNELTIVTGYVDDLTGSDSGTEIFRVVELRNPYGDTWSVNLTKWSGDMDLDFIQTNPDQIKAALDEAAESINDAYEAAQRTMRNATNKVNALLGIQDAFLKNHVEVPA